MRVGVRNVVNVKQLTSASFFKRFLEFEFYSLTAKKEMFEEKKGDV